MVERDAAPFEEEQGGGAEPVAAAFEALSVAAERPSDGAVHELAKPAEPVLQVDQVGHDETGGRGGSRGTNVGGEIAERRVLLVADGRDDGYGACCERPDDGLVAERQEIVEAPAAPGDDDDVDSRMGCDPPDRRGDAPAGASALDARLGDDDVSRGEARADAGDDVAPRGCVGARDDADRPWKARQGALALGVRTALQRPARA